MANQTGIEIHIKAWLPTGKGLDEQFTALSLVKAAHESGDYAPLLKAASIEAVKTESKTRRMEVVAPTASTATGITQEEILAAGESQGLPTPAGETEIIQTSPFPPEAHEPTPESNVGEAPIDQPSLVPDEPQDMPNPIKRGRKAA